MPCVYWIHLQEHADFLSEGYIGFTSKSAEKRFRQHCAGARSQKERCPHLEKAIRKYGASQLITDTLCIGTPDYCIDLERKLRPHPMIEDKRPIDIVIQSEFGAELVIEILGRLKYGTAA